MPGDEKDSARDIACWLLQAHGDIENLVFRVNTVASGLMFTDLEALLPLGVRAVRLADPHSRSDVEMAINLIKRKATCDVRVEMMVENVVALNNLPSIVEGFPEIQAVTFGGSDYLSDIGSISLEDLWQGKERLVHMAAKCHLSVYDTVFSDYSQREPVFEDAVRAAKLGFDGKSVIHPAQIPVTREAFHTV